MQHAIKFAAVALDVIIQVTVANPPNQPIRDFIRELRLQFVDEV